MTDEFKSLGVKIVADLGELDGQLGGIEERLVKITAEKSIKVSLLGITEKKVALLNEAAAAIERINRAQGGAAASVASAPARGGLMERMQSQRVGQSMPQGTGPQGTVHVEAELKAVSQTLRADIEEALKAPFDIHLRVANLDQIREQLSGIGVQFTATPASGGTPRPTSYSEPTPAGAPRQWSEGFRGVVSGSDTGAGIAAMYGELQDARKAMGQALMAHANSVEDMFDQIARHYGSSLDEMMKLSAPNKRGEQEIVGGTIAPLIKNNDALHATALNFHGVTGAAFPRWRAETEAMGSRSATTDAIAGTTIANTAAIREQTEAIKAAQQANSTVPGAQAGTGGAILAERVAAEAVKAAQGGTATPRHGVVGMAEIRSIEHIANEIASYGELARKQGTSRHPGTDLAPTQATIGGKQYKLVYAVRQGTEAADFGKESKPQGTGTSTGNPLTILNRSVAGAANPMNPGMASQGLTTRMAVNGIDITNVIETAIEGGFRGYAEKVGQGGKGTGEYVQAWYDNGPENIAAGVAGKVAVAPGKYGSIPGQQGSFRGISPSEMARKTLLQMGVPSEAIDDLLKGKEPTEKHPEGELGALQYAIRQGNNVPLPEAMRSSQAHGGLWGHGYARPDSGLSVVLSPEDEAFNRDQAQRAKLMQAAGRGQTSDVGRMIDYGLGGGIHPIEVVEGQYGVDIRNSSYNQVPTYASLTGAQKRKVGRWGKQYGVGVRGVGLAGRIQYGDLEPGVHPYELAMGQVGWDYQTTMANPEWNRAGPIHEPRAAHWESKPVNRYTPPEVAFARIKSLAGQLPEDKAALLMKWANNRVEHTYQSGRGAADENRERIERQAIDPESEHRTRWADREAIERERANMESVPELDAALRAVAEGFWEQARSGNLKIEGVTNPRDPSLPAGFHDYVSAGYQELQTSIADLLGFRGKKRPTPTAAGQKKFLKALQDAGFTQLAAVFPAIHGQIAAVRGTPGRYDPVSKKMLPATGAIGDAERMLSRDTATRTRESDASYPARTETDDMIDRLERELQVLQNAVPTGQQAQKGGEITNKALIASMPRYKKVGRKWVLAGSKSDPDAWSGKMGDPTSAYVGKDKFGAQPSPVRTTLQGGAIPEGEFERLTGIPLTTSMPAQGGVGARTYSDVTDISFPETMTERQYKAWQAARQTTADKLAAAKRLKSDASAFGNQPRFSGFQGPDVVAKAQQEGHSEDFIKELTQQLATRAPGSLGVTSLKPGTERVPVTGQEMQDRVSQTIPIPGSGSPEHVTAAIDSMLGRGAVERAQAGEAGSGRVTGTGHAPTAMSGGGVVDVRIVASIPLEMRGGGRGAPRTGRLDDLGRLDKNLSPDSKFQTVLANIKANNPNAKDSDIAAALRQLGFHAEANALYGAGGGGKGGGKGKGASSGFPGGLPYAVPQIDIDKAELSRERQAMAFSSPVPRLQIDKAEQARNKQRERETRAANAAAASSGSVSGQLGVSRAAVVAALRRGGVGEDQIEGIYSGAGPSRSGLEDDQQRLILQARQKAAASRAQLPSRALSTSIIQLTQRLLGERTGPETRILELQQEASDQARIAQQGVNIRGRQRAAGAEYGGLIRARRQILNAGGVVAPEIDQAIKQSREGIMRETKARKANEIALVNQTKKVDELSTKVVTPRDILSNLSAGFIGGIAGGFVTQGVSLATQGIMAFIDNVGVPALERATGNQGIANRVNAENAGILQQAGYNKEGLLTSLFQSGMGVSQMDRMGGELYASAAGIAGNRQFAQRIQQQQAYFADLKQREQLGLPQGYAPSLLRDQGGVFNMYNPLTGGFMSPGGETNTQKLLADSLTEGGLRVRGLDIRQVAMQSLRSTPIGFMVPNDTTSQEAKAARTQANIDIQNKTLEDAGLSYRFRRADLSSQADRDLSTAQGAVMQNTGAYDLQKAMGDFGLIIEGLPEDLEKGKAAVLDLLKAIGTGQLSPAAYMRSQQERALPNMKDMFREMFRLQQRNTAAGQALGVITNPLQPFNMGIVGGADGMGKVAGLDRYQGIFDEATKALTARQQQGQSILEELVGDDGAESLRLLGEVSTEIAGLQKEAAGIQVAQQMREYNHQLMLAQRSVGDLAGLIGKAGGTDIGVMERQNMLAQRRLQLMQLQDQQMSLNYQRALAGFTYEGATPEEAADRQRIAEIKARRQQTELNLSKGLFTTGVKIVDEQNLRAFKEAVWQEKELERRINDTRRLSAIGNTVQRLGVLQNQLEQDVQNYISKGQQLESNAAGWAQTVADATGKLITEVYNDAVAVFKQAVKDVRDAVPEVTTTQPNSSGSPDDRNNPDATGGIPMRESRSGMSKIVFDFRGAQVRSEDDINEIVAAVEQALNRKAALFGIRRL